MPLVTGEIVHGRVIGLGEQVTLQRIRPASGSADSLPTPDVPTVDAGDRIGGAIAALFERYQARIDLAEFNALQRLAQRSPAPEQAALAGLVLNKLGLQIAPEFFRAVYAALSKPDEAGLFALPAQALALAAGGRAAAADDEAVPALADGLRRALIDVPEARLRETRGEAPDDDRGRRRRGWR